MKRSVNSGYLFAEQFTELTKDRISHHFELRENNWGVLDGERSDTAASSILIMERNKDKFCANPYNGESYADLYHRVSVWLDKMDLRNNPHEHSVFHVHCNVSKVLIGKFMKYNPKDWMDLHHSQNLYYIISNNDLYEVNYEANERRQL